MHRWKRGRPHRQRKKRERAEEEEQEQGGKGRGNKDEEHKQKEATTAVVSPARFVQVAKLSGEAYNTRRPMTSEGLILPFGRISKGSKSSSNR